MCNSSQLLSTCRKQMDRGVGFLGRVRADHGIEEVDVDIDYTTLHVGSCGVASARTRCWLMPPGHIAKMAWLTLVGNVALAMEAPTGNPRFPPRPLRFAVIHTLWSTADPITSWYCYRYARTSQAFRFLFLNALKSEFSSAIRRRLFSHALVS